MDSGKNKQKRGKMQEKNCEFSLDGYAQLW